MVAALTDGAITDRPSLRPTVTLEEGGRHDIDGGHAMHEANHDRTHRSRTSASVGRSVCVPTLTGVDRCPIRSAPSGQTCPATSEAPPPLLRCTTMHGPRARQTSGTAAITASE